MELDHQHPLYAKHAGQWKRCRDAVEGQDAIHAAGDAYLPMLSGQSVADFRKYLARATYFNASGRTVLALSGMLMKQQARIEVPAGFEEILADVTLDGCSLRDFVTELVTQQLTVGRVGIAVDFPRNDADPVTVGIAQALRLRPYLRCYMAESIVDWRVGDVAGGQGLTMVKLMEQIEVPSGEFSTASVLQYRVLDLFEGAYRVRLYRKDKGDQWFLLEEYFPQMNGAAIPFIPFVIANVSKVGAKPEKSPILDMVDVNLAHYRNTADYEHGLHFTGLPTPVIAGVQLDDKVKLGIGSSEAWVFPDPAAKASYLEFTGTGLSALADAIKEKERRMAVLGARMLSDEKRTAESTETTLIKHDGEHSALASIALCASEAIQQALKMMCQWAGMPDDVTYQLNTDYGIRRLTAQELTALVGAWQSGAFSAQTLFKNLQAGQIISDQTDFETEQAQIADAAPVLSQGAPSEAAPEQASQESRLQGFMRLLRL
jgi:hypothetical protein